MSKYETKYVELCDKSILTLVEEALTKEITAVHSASHLVNLGNGKWLVRLEYSVVKDMDNLVKGVT